MEGPSVILVCEDSDVRDVLIGELDVLRDQFPNLKVVGLGPNQISPDLEKSAQAIVLDIEHWSHADEMMISGLRGTGYKGPILVLGLFEPNQQKPTSKLFEKVVFLNKPYDLKEMVGVVRRMVLAPIIAARRHKRHDTNEKAELQIEGKPSLYSCKVKNMSKGGAYLEFTRPLDVRIGDSVILHIRLGKLEKEYLLRSRVAWVNTRGAGFGIEFASALSLGSKG